jgi:hypothetical protein
MIVKKVIGEEGLTVSEAKEILDRVKEERSGEELGYELQTSFPGRGTNSAASMLRNGSCSPQRILIRYWIR